ncbi:MAG: hypothetical protein DCC55_27765 [Chloroflexi bacterium]|nr:MAG: hypothetical protein DCC55_27765 [Chloroflexota bacterium]
MQSHVRPPSLNGHHAAPPSSGGAFAAVRGRTVFPHERVLPAPATLLYAWQRRQIAGTPLIRLPQWLLLTGGVLWATSLLPGRWWGAGLCLLLLLALQGTLWWLRRHDFVHFTPGALPLVRPQPLEPAAKIPLFATGLFGVERKEQRFTWLPGFYRTFATREHALLCQVNDHPAGFGSSPPEEEGLWYVFFTPATIESVEGGNLSFGRNHRPALAVCYRHIPARQKEKQSPTSQLETVYLAFQQEADCHTVLADLLFDLPAAARQQLQPAEQSLSPCKP